MDSILPIQQRWQNENRERRQLWPIILGAYSALIFHIGFLIIFFIYGVTPLFYFNIISIVVFALIIYVLLKQQAFRFSMLVASLEIYLHQLLAVYYLGWEYNFQLYLIAIPVFLFLGEFKNKLTPLLLSVLVIFSIVLAYFVSLEHSAEYDLGSLKEVAPIFNMVAIAVLLAFYTGIFSSSSKSFHNTLQQSQKDIELLYQAATIDDLTKLPNRLHAQNLIEMWLKQSIQDEKPMTIAFIDLDNFKQINDQFGHETGDTVLQHVATILDEQIREHGLVARWGGEEFIAAFPNKDEHEAKSILEESRKAVVAAPYHSNEICIHLSITIGATSCSAFEQPKQLQELLKIADIALYEGKTGSKNCLVFRSHAQV